ncbi:MAG TPA: PQQ-binding-like beta-propeller repeat protein [Clostridia bacterium]|nr:PQQ-binding-like beta-propeller repeat protein [Clostridia bacterium]
MKIILAHRWIFLAGFFLGAFGSLFASDWPQFLGPHGNGKVDEPLVNKDWTNRAPARVWSLEMQDNGYAAPCAAMGKVFVIDHMGDDDVVRALDLKSGKEVWRFAYAAKEKDSFGHALATPAFDEGRLYTLSREGLLHCLDATCGTNIWSCNLMAKFEGQLAFYRMVTSPKVDGDRLIVCPGGKAGVVALNKRTGAMLWSSPNGEPMGHATPVSATVAGAKVYLCFSGLNLLGLDAADGHIRWRFPWKTVEAMNTANPVIVSSNEVLITCLDNGTALLRIEGDNRVTQVWKNSKIRSYYGTPLLHRGLVFAKDDSKDLVCFDVATGQERWRQPNFGTKWCDAGGILLDGVIVIANGRTGDLFLVAAQGEGYRQLGWIPSPAGQETLPAPILADGHLILRSKKRLVALNMAGASGHSESAILTSPAIRP